MNLSLLQYVGLKTSDLTPAVVSEIAQAFGKKVNIDEPGTKGLITLLQQNDVHALADLLGRPELMQKFKVFISPRVQTEEGQILQCRHCGEFNVLE